MPILNIKEFLVKERVAKEFTLILKTIINSYIDLYNIKDFSCFVISRHAFQAAGIQTPKYFAHKNSQTKIIAISDEVPLYLRGIWFDHEINCGPENHYQQCASLFAEEIKFAKTNLTEEQFGKYLLCRTKMLSDIIEFFPEHLAIENIKKSLQLFEKPEEAIALAR